jgi:hypothetical protein
MHVLELVNELSAKISVNVLEKIRSIFARGILPFFEPVQFQYLSVAPSRLSKINFVSDVPQFDNGLSTTTADSAEAASFYNFQNPLEVLLQKSCRALTCTRTMVATFSQQLTATMSSGARDYTANSILSATR